MTKRIGLLVGWENTFPPAFLDRLNAHAGVHAELAKIGGTGERFEKKYDVLVDRISHEVQHYRLHLKAAQLAGTYVINDPLWWSADDKFFGFSMAAKLGCAVPKTILLPQRDYIPSIDKTRSLRNLEFPLDWKAITDYVGFPAFLKPAEGGGWKNVTKVHNEAELLAAYNVSGTLVMTLQECIEFDDFVRCICLGRDMVLPIRWDPHRRSYLVESGFFPKQLGQRVVDDAWKICNALGYDMNSVEFAIKDGVPYAIDFTNPAPDMDYHSITPHYFDIVVEEMVKLTLRVASEGRTPRVPYNFGDFLPGGARSTELGPIARILAAGGDPGAATGGGVVAR